MAITMQQVRSHLDSEEVDYPAAAAALGTQALPVLQQLAEEADPMLASKAIYLASMIGGDGAVPILQAAVDHDDPVRRVAAASGLKNLAEDAAGPLADRLLSDRDVGVRKVALHGAAAFSSPSMVERLRRAAADDPEPTLRQLANRALGK